MQMRFPASLCTLCAVKGDAEEYFECATSTDDSIHYVYKGVEVRLFSRVDQPLFPIIHLVTLSGATQRQERVLTDLQRRATDTRDLSYLTCAPGGFLVDKSMGILMKPSEVTIVCK